MEYDYRAIEQLLFRYAECIADGNLEQLALLFTHGRISAAGMPDAAVGEAAVLAMYRAATRIYPDNGTPHTQHLVANPIIELDPDGTSAQWSQPLYSTASGARTDITGHHLRSLSRQIAKNRRPMVV